MYIGKYAPTPGKGGYRLMVLGGQKYEKGEEEEESPVRQHAQNQSSEPDHHPF
jgi:hypothetical protein